MPPFSGSISRYISRFMEARHFSSISAVHMTSVPHFLNIRSKHSIYYLFVCFVLTKRTIHPVFRVCLEMWMCACIWAQWIKGAPNSSHIHNTLYPNTFMIVHWPFYKEKEMYLHTGINCEWTVCILMFRFKKVYTDYRTISTRTVWQWLI